METLSTFASDNLQPPQMITIPVIEESLTIDKKLVETGRLQVTKKVEEVNELLDISLLHDEYSIEHIAMNEYVDDMIPTVRHEGDTIIIPVIKEVMVKRVMLIEEVHITKRVVHTTTQQNIALRKESIEATHLFAHEEVTQL